MKKDFISYVRGTIIPPEDGWKEHTLYLAEVSYFAQNPIHNAMVYVGFLDSEGEPGNYSGVMQFLPSIHECDMDKKIKQMYYVKILDVLAGPAKTRVSTSRLPPKPNTDEQILKLEKQHQELLTKIALLKAQFGKS
jgi:hypothetical protein